MSLLKWLSGLGVISLDDLRDWMVDYLYRVDMGLMEYELEYFKKFKKNRNKELNKDKGYNQLQGKFTMLLALSKDFNLPLPEAGDRIKERILDRGGTIIINNGRSITKVTNKSNTKARRVSPRNR